MDTQKANMAFARLKDDFDYTSYNRLIIHLFTGYSFPEG